MSAQPALRFLLVFAILLGLPTIIYSLEICPIDKMPTEITIDHKRHPRNLALGVTTNSIEITTKLVATDRETGEMTALANKEILFEITILDKFLVFDQQTSTFKLSDKPGPFPVNTSADGTVKMTIYTDPPILPKALDPRKISYSITASYAPKPKEPFIGSMKTERYTPGSVPLFSMLSCLPLLLVVALLLFAQYASGRDPLAAFDFSRFAFRAPTIRRAPVKGIAIDVNALMGGMLQKGLVMATNVAIRAPGKVLSLAGKGAVLAGSGISKLGEKLRTQKTQVNPKTGESKKGAPIAGTVDPKTGKVVTSAPKPVEPGTVSKGAGTVLKSIGSGLSSLGSGLAVSGTLLSLTLMTRKGTWSEWKKSRETKRETIEASEIERKYKEKGKSMAGVDASIEEMKKSLTSKELKGIQSYAKTQAWVGTPAERPKNWQEMRQTIQLMLKNLAMINASGMAIRMLSVSSIFPPALPTPSPKSNVSEGEMIDGLGEDANKYLQEGKEVAVATKERHEFNAKGEVTKVMTIVLDKKGKPTESTYVRWKGIIDKRGKLILNEVAAGDRTYLINSKTGQAVGVERKNNPGQFMKVSLTKEGMQISKRAKFDELIASKRAEKHGKYEPLLEMLKLAVKNSNSNLSEETLRDITTGKSDLETRLFHREEYKKVLDKLVDAIHKSEIPGLEDISRGELQNMFKSVREQAIRTTDPSNPNSAGMSVPQAAIALTHSASLSVQPEDPTSIRKTYRFIETALTNDLAAKLPTASRDSIEKFVLDPQDQRSKFWNNLNDAEQKFAFSYANAINLVGIFASPPPALADPAIRENFMSVLNAKAIDDDKTATKNLQAFGDILSKDIFERFKNTCNDENLIRSYVVGEINADELKERIIGSKQLTGTPSQIKYAIEKMRDGTGEVPGLDGARKIYSAANSGLDGGFVDGTAFTGWVDSLVIHSAQVTKIENEVLKLKRNDLEKQLGPMAPEVQKLAQEIAANETEISNPKIFKNPHEAVSLGPLVYEKTKDLVDPKESALTKEEISNSSMSSLAANISATEYFHSIFKPLTQGIIAEGSELKTVSALGISGSPPEVYSTLVDPKNEVKADEESSELRSVYKKNILGGLIFQEAKPVVPEEKAVAKMEITKGKETPQLKPVVTKFTIEEQSEETKKNKK